jgi:hypothetical protein
MTAIPFAQDPLQSNIYCDLMACNKLCNSDHINSVKWLADYITVTTINTGEVKHFCNDDCLNEHRRRNKTKQRRE